MSSLMELTVATTDDKTYEVKAVFADLIKYDILRSRLNFPNRTESEFAFMGLVAFSALIRTGQIPNETKPQEFLDRIASLEPVESEEAEAEFPA